MNAELYRYFEHAVYGTDQPSRFKPNNTKIANLVGSVRAVTHISRDHVVPSWLDGRTKPPATDIIPVANGILHVPSRKIYAPTPTLLVMHATPFAYDPSAPMPEGWLKFLKEIFPDDPESIMALQEWFGYLLSGDMSQQKILLIIGPKRSGKGTILRILKAIMGARYVAAPTLTSMSSSFGLQPLIGKPLALISDARIYGSHSVVVERLLSISGEDAITIDRKNREAWTGTLPTRIVIATNELPRLSDASGALVSRMIILNTPESFYGRENHDLTDDLMEELPGILNWALDGLDRLRRTGRLSVPESGLALRAEMETLASPVKAFVNDWCVVDHRLSIHREYLFKAWERWCAENRVQPGDGRVFGRNLKAAVPHLRNLRLNQAGERIWAYSGIGLRDDVVAYLGTLWW